MTNEMAAPQVARIIFGVLAILGAVGVGIFVGMGLAVLAQGDRDRRG